jgi:hypothetical protein
LKRLIGSFQAAVRQQDPFAARGGISMLYWMTGVLKSVIGTPGGLL